MTDIPLGQLPYPEEETRTFELSTSLSPNWDKNGRIYYTDETGQVVRPQTKYNPLQMLGRRLKAFGSNAKNFVEDFNMDKSHTYFAPFEDINEQYKAGNIDKSELPYLAQGRAEQEIREAQQQERDNINRGWLGTGLSAASMHPIFNIPYVGTGLGGAMYDLGQGITEGNYADELWDRTKRGFAIGESVGAIPYVGKLAGKTKAGQAVGNALNKAGEKFANTKLYDALMTDIKGFSPFKQTGYHGSPYDFNKFSNEAIGTGEGAQAHGYGHYVALNKDIAEGYRNKLSTTTPEENLIKQYGKEKVINDLQKDLNDSLQELQALQKAKIEQAKVKDFGRKNPIDYDNSIKLVEEEINNLQNRIYNVNNPQISGQLYKLSIPKDDVMLREGATLAEQPKKVQDAIYKLGKYENNFPSVNYNGNTYYYTPGLFKGWKKAINNNIDMYNDPRINDSELIKILDSVQDKGSVTYKGNKFKATNTGQEIYNKLGKDASAQLNNAGIKGISYNGGIDGEARVIFNPKDIEIIRKYYNQPGLFEQLTGASNSGAAVDSLYNKIAR